MQVWHISRHVVCDTDRNFFGFDRNNTFLTIFKPSTPNKLIWNLVNIVKFMCKRCDKHYALRPNLMVAFECLCRRISIQLCSTFERVWCRTSIHTRTIAAFFVANAMCVRQLLIKRIVIWSITATVNYY